MFPKRLSIALFLVGVALAPVPAPQARAQEHHHDVVGPAEKLGKVHFPVSCSPAAQKEFDRAVAMLHSFW